MCDSMGANDENENEINSILTEELRILLKQKLPIAANVCLVLFIGGFVLQAPPKTMNIKLDKKSQALLK